MVVTEVINDRLRKTYSDAGFMLRKVGTNEIYTAAVDLVTSSATYEETDEKIPEEIKEKYKC